MPKIFFRLVLPDGQKSAFLSVSGGADADRDGTIEDDREVAQFERVSANTWTRSQDVDSPTGGMVFAVMFTIGPSVKWELTITHEDGRLLYTAANTTLFASETVSYVLQ